MKKNNPIIYIHYGFSKYLPYVFEATKISNPNTDVILLGDPSNKKVAEEHGLIHYSLKDFDYGDDLKTFDQIYELIVSPHFDSYKHGEDWNKFVFRKWFVLYNFITKQGIKKFWHFDSDNPIATDLSTLEDQYSDLDCTLQCHGNCFKGIFNDPEIINRYIKKVNEVFLRKDYITQKKEELAKMTTPCSVNEMTIYEIFAREETVKSIDLSEISGNSFFDDLLCRSQGMKMETLPLGEDIKVTYLNPDGRFFCVDNATGKYVLAHALNLSWMPLYIYKAVANHLRKNFAKPHQPFSPKAKTLAQVPVPLKQRLKFWRKRIQKSLKGE